MNGFLDWIRDIRIPKSNIYFHSLNWDVDYIKPEIVPMYDPNATPSVSSLFQL